MTINEAIDILSCAPQWDKKSNDAIRMAIGILKIVNDSQGLVKDLVKENGDELSKPSDELVKIYKHLWFCIGETLVEESKCHMSPEKALDRIREYMQQADIERWKVEGKYE